MGVGNLLGNLLGVVLIIVASLIGFVSLKASAITFTAIAYGLWGWIRYMNSLLGRMNSLLGREVSDSFLSLLLAEELRVFQYYNIHIRFPAAGEMCSALLNLLRLAGFVWAGLCVWHGHYVLAVIAAAFFFASGGVILKTDPLLYLGKATRANRDFAQRELSMLESVKVKIKM